MAFVIKKKGIVDFDVEFIDKVCVLNGDSGSGKSFLMEYILSILDVSDLTVLHFSYRNLPRTEEEFMRDCSKLSDLILFDNSDLYLTTDILNIAREHSKLILISTHSINAVYYGACGFYEIEFTGDSLVAKRY